MGDGGRVAGVILAAGSSRRMGRNKLLLDFGGDPLIRVTTGVARDAGLDPVLVVIEPGAAEVRKALGEFPCQLVPNAHARSGMRSSLAAGLSSVPADVDAAIVLLADMPRVSSPMLAELRSTYEAAPNLLIVASRYGETIAPPHLFDRRVFDEVARSGGDGQGGLMVGTVDRVAYVSWSEDALADIDTPQDYTRLHRD